MNILFSESTQLKQLTYVKAKVPVLTKSQTVGIKLTSAAFTHLRGCAGKTK